MFFAEVLHGLQVKGVSQRVGHHDCLGFGRDSALESFDIRIISLELDINHYRAQIVLDDWVHSCWETHSHRQDLVPRH